MVKKIVVLMLVLFINFALVAGPVFSVSANRSGSMGFLKFLDTSCIVRNSGISMSAAVGFNSDFTVLGKIGLSYMQEMKNFTPFAGICNGRILTLGLGTVLEKKNLTVMFDGGVRIIDIAGDNLNRYAMFYVCAGPVIAVLNSEGLGVKLSSPVTLSAAGCGWGVEAGLSVLIDYKGGGGVSDEH